MQLVQEEKSLSLDEEIQQSLSNWKEITRRYQIPDKAKAFTQILTSFLPYVGLWVLMYFSLNWSIFITIGLAAVNAFFLVRIFIIQHDCGHQSFFQSKKVNNAIGVACSFFTSIPYKYWAKVHNFHHGHSGQLEVREIGDIPFMTVQEYRKKGWLGKTLYRIFRMPLTLFVIAPVFYILVSNRFPFFKLRPKMAWEQIRNNLLIAAVYVGLAFLLGWKQFLIVQFTLLFLFAIIAFWFFFVQHQHETAYKQWKKNWDFLSSAIRGSTFYNLPSLFHWLTGNIGFHHIHHLSSAIPNYNLKKCYRENPILSKYVTSIKFGESLKLMFHKLWDEERQRMITFREYYRMERMRLSV